MSRSKPSFHKSMSSRSMSMMVTLLIVFICALDLPDLAMCNKYSKTVNTASKDDLDFENQENPFRMQKVNLLWSKAKKRLTGVKLADLYADLKIHDKHEAHLKKLKGDNLDQDGAMEAKVLTNYKRIIDRFGLDDIFYDHDAYMRNEIPLQDSGKRGTHFSDPKLQAMWARAEEAGFSDEDLEMLKQEFWHQQMKINEFNFVHHELEAAGDPDDNTIDPSKSKSHEKKKAKMDIQDKYMKLERMMSNLDGSEPTFKDSRVHKLWALAKKTNWTEEELEAFKKELMHFEHRLNKQAFYKEQLDLSVQALEEDLKEEEDYPEKHLHLKEKHDSIGQRVQKLHSHLKTRLEKALRHSEL